MRRCGLLWLRGGAARPAVRRDHDDGGDTLPGGTVSALAAYLGTKLEKPSRMNPSVTLTLLGLVGLFRVVLSILILLVRRST